MTDGDCVVAPQILDCCGSAMIFGVNRFDVGWFELLDECRMGAPLCDCIPLDSVDELGNVIGSAGVSVSCEGSTCIARAS